MPTLGIESKLTFATSKGRTDLNSFYRALSVDGMTTKVLSLNSNASGSISLVSSEFVIVVCLEDCLTIVLTNNDDEIISFTDIGYIAVKASNLKSIALTNNDTVAREISVYF